MMQLDRDTEQSCDRHLWKRFSALLWLCITLAIVQPAQAGIAEGLTWLASQQGADGEYTDPANVASNFQSTAEVLRTLYFLGETGQAGIVGAENYLQAETHRNTENLARLIIATADSGGDVTGLVADLLTHQGLDGGYGELSGYDSSVLDTAFALDALAFVNQPLDQSTAEAVYFLLSRQQADGGWLDGRNDSSVYTTALVVQALRPYKEEFSGVDSALAAAKRYLVSAQVDSGLWNETFESALALIALVNIVNEFSEVEALVNELRNRQSADGSWGGSSYSTALVLRALASQPTPLPSPPTSGDISGRLLNAATGQPVVGAAVRIQGSAANASSDVTGNFTVAELEPGQKNILISAPGYLDKTYVGTVIAGKTLGLGDIFMSLLPTVSTLQGVIVDMQTGLPVEGAAVSVSGSATSGSVSTGRDGSYALDGLAPGSVSLSVTKSGYLTVTANGLLVAGSTTTFSPRLMPANINEETADDVTGFGVLQGRVADKLTRQALAGVTIAISGTASATTTTASDGSYRFPDLPPGEITITLSMPGYVSSVATARVVADSVLTFDLLLAPETGSVTANGSLTGKVEDLATGNPLGGVVITVTNGTENRVLASAASGSFSVTQLPAGNYSAAFELTGFKRQTLENIVISDGARVDLQAIRLEKLVSDVTLAGVLTDGENGRPIANATVTIHGTSIGVQTDNDGRYRIEGLDTGTKTLIFSATGYSSQSLILDFPQGGVYQVDRVLKQGQLSVLSFDLLSVGQFSYPAYADVQIQGAVRNDSTSPVDAQVEYTILNEQGQVVDTVRGFWVDSSGQEKLTFRFDPGENVPLQATWNTGFTMPGIYRVIARVVVGDVMVGPSTVTLAERVSSFSIEPTESIPRLSITPLPGYSGVGRTDQVTYQVDITNRSNIDTALTLNYQLLSPMGRRVGFEHVETINLRPEEDNKSILLQGDTVTFERSGEHLSSARVVSGTEPAEIIEHGISVAPGIRVQPDQNISPSTVTPDEDKRIRINIRLEGVELR